MDAPTSFPAASPPGRRSLPKRLAPLDQLAATSASLITRHDARFEVRGEAYTLPRYLFIGPHAGGDPLRLGLFAAIHGDEPAGACALVELLQFLEASPALVAGYCLFAYPVTNPTGFEDNTRHSRRGRDLNREFWNNSKEPEVLLLQSELIAHACDGIIALHADDTSDGIYGFVRGATLTLFSPNTGSSSLTHPTCKLGPTPALVPVASLVTINRQQPNL